mmetsp:Transcript_18825/g.26325  ORF Transcript_18825/g.26325 Transcript_18825/m.26325 type:complete len:149 (-) Transcript_18825:542-988(-)
MNSSQPFAKVDPQCQIQDVYLFEGKLREAIENMQMLPSRRTQVENTVFGIVLFLSVFMCLDFIYCLFNETCTTSTLRMFLALLVVAALARLLILRNHRKCHGRQKNFELFNRALRKFNIMFDDKSKKLLLLKQKNQRSNLRASSSKSQ